MKRTSLGARVAIALTAWLVLAYVVGPVSFTVFVGEALPELLWGQFELHAFFCAVGVMRLSDVLPSLRPFADSLTGGDMLAGITITPAGWAVMVTVHLLIATIITGLGTGLLGALESRLERRH